MEHEITETGPLLNARGGLREPGWAKTPILEYDRGAITASGFRIKEWDYYCVLAGDFALAFTIADNSYMGLLSVSAIDLKAGSELTESVMTAFPMGRTRLPSSSAYGVTAASSKGLSLRFEAKGGKRKISAKWPDFGTGSKGKAEKLFGVPAVSDSIASAQGSVGFEADILLSEKPQGESVVIATPFEGAPRAFYYNRKINCMDAEGRARVGRRDFVLLPGKAFGVLDWGRGVWTYSNAWLWGSASGLARVEDREGEVSFGFNIGYGFGDTRAASENMVFVDGKAHKIGRLSIDFDGKDFLKPWKARSEDGRLNLILKPILDRAAVTDFLLLASIQHQVFGKWSGSVELEDGRKVMVEGLPGFCEKVKNRW